ncbi:Hypothetical protein ETEE_3591 [Edwardsiella anguillarum ET080813]|uniref:Uncharacterized protein n=1 Tax=Edwardsiella anguillarum ET080813 TaxID=667120 RepID=A0A076LQ08_9GAMM|nr:Hypothetical protein ETEE_3591 [Edwardsiella anguillarum ET080813]
MYALYITSAYGSVENDRREEKRLFCIQPPDRREKTLGILD